MAINYSNTLNNLKGKLARQEQAVIATREHIAAMEALQKYEAEVAKSKPTSR